MNRLLVSLATAFLAVAFTLGAHFFASAQTMAPAPVAFGGGEQLTYTVSYRAKLIPPINVMNVTLRTIDESFGGRSHFHIVGNGKTTSIAKSFFTLNDTYHSWLDTGTLLPSRMTSDLQEDNYRLKATYNYDWASMTVSNTVRNARWEADRHATIALKPGSGDAVSLFYRLRQTDVSSLTPGRAYPLDLVLNESSQPISFRFVGREEIKVRKVGTFRALKFTCTMATDDGTTYEEGMTLTVWISDDDNKIPLLMESPIRVGRVSVSLAPGAKVLHPLTSKIK